MKGKKIGGIVCIIIGVLIGLVFINDSSKNDTRAELIENVVLIEDINQISEANEGKAIIVTGHPELPQDAIDSKTGIHAKAPYLKRVEETYKWMPCKQQYRKSNDDYCMEWGSSGSEEFEVDAKIGSYSIPCKTLLSLSMPQKSLPLTQEDAARLGMQIDQYDNKYYLTKTPGLRSSSTRHDGGAQRISYGYKDLSGYETITVLGIQEKGSVVTNDMFSAHSYDHAMTRDEVIAQYKEDQKEGFMIGMIVMAIFILIGGILIHVSRKQ